MVIEHCGNLRVGLQHEVGLSHNIAAKLQMVSVLLQSRALSQLASVLLQFERKK